MRRYRRRPQAARGAYRRSRRRDRYARRSGQRPTRRNSRAHPPPTASPPPRSLRSACRYPASRARPAPGRAPESGRRRGAAPGLAPLEPYATRARTLPAPAPSPRRSGPPSRHVAWRSPRRSPDSGPRTAYRRDPRPPCPRSSATRPGGHSVMWSWQVAPEMTVEIVLDHGSGGGRRHRPAAQRLAQIDAVDQSAQPFGQPLGLGPRHQADQRIQQVAVQPPAIDHEQPGACGADRALA